MSFSKMFVVALSSLLIGVSLHAAPVSWSNDAGVSAGFDWSNGAGDPGFSGNPIHINGTFIFIPSGLKAVAVNSSNTVSDIIHVKLTPEAGKRISTITAQLSGDGSVQGDGEAGFAATLDAFNLATNSHAINSINPAPLTTQGTFDESFSLNIPQNFGTIDLTLTTEMSVAVQNGSATAEMKVIRLGVQTASGIKPPVVPLPAAVFAFPGAAVVAAWGAKKMKLRA